MLTVISGGKQYSLHCNANVGQAGHLRVEDGYNWQQCADICALEPQCGSVDFIPSANSCNLKKAAGPAEGPWEGHSWTETQCPVDRASEADATPQVASLDTGVLCPRGTYYNLPAVVLANDPRRR